MEWEDWYLLAKKYYEKNGNINMHYNKKNGDDYDESIVKLGKWLSKQRSKYSKRLLSDIQIKLLEELKIVWDPFEEK